MWGIRKTLEKVKIATPTKILADLVAFRIAQLPADPSAPYHANDGTLKLKLTDGRILYVHKKDIKYIIRYADPNRVECKRVWISLDGTEGEPHRTVNLTEEEAQSIIREIIAYEKRCVALSFLQQESRNQHDALDIVERLI